MTIAVDDPTYRCCTSAVGSSVHVYIGQGWAQCGMGRYVWTGWPWSRWHLRRVVARYERRAERLNRRAERALGWLEDDITARSDVKLTIPISKDGR